MMKEDITYPGVCYKRKTGCGNIFIICARDPQTKKLVDIHVYFGKGGGCANAVMADMNALFRLLLKQPKHEQIATINEMKGNICQFLNRSCRLILAETIYEELLKEVK